MAFFCDIDEYLQQLSSLYPHYHVGETSERSEGTIRSWVVAVKMDRGEILLKLPEKKGQGRDWAITLEQLDRSIRSLSPQDHDTVELCLCEGNGFRVDNGIVGALIMHEEQALVFLACDPSSD
ncbi:MAG: hypothetical protein KBE65_13495 [Phycisphaerae bacterium]|nr:hypothetical protein [Phycisphaerae bacterium]